MTGLRITRICTNAKLEAGSTAHRELPPTGSTSLLCVSTAGRGAASSEAAPASSARNRVRRSV